MNLTSKPPTVLCRLLPENLSKESRGGVNRCRPHTQCLQPGRGTGGLLAFTSIQSGRSVQIIVLLSQMGGFPQSSVGKESACNAGDSGSVPELGRSTGEGIGYLLQYSGLENSMDCIVHVVAKGQTRLGDFLFEFSARRFSTSQV